MGRRLVGEELRQEACSRAGDQRIAVLEQHLERQPAVAADRLLQLEQRGGVEHRNLSA